MKKLALLIVIVLSISMLAGCQKEAGVESNGNSEVGNETKEENVKPVTLKIGHGASESYHMHRAWLKFKEVLEATGNFVVEIYPSSQFGNDAEMIESVKTGDLTMATPPSSFLVNEAPNLALIELPYVFSSRENAVATLKGEWGSKQLKELEKEGMLGLGYLENGLRHLTNSKKEVRSPEDLQGLKLRTMQVPAHVYLWNDLGATAEGAPFSELYTNLSTGVFDGQENPVAHIYSQKFFEVQDYISLTGHVYTAYLPVFNLEVWNTLSSDRQAAVNEAFEAARVYQLELIEAEEGAQLEEIQNSTTYPTTVIELTVEEKKAFMDAAEPTLDHYRNELGAEVFDEFRAAAKAAE